MIRDAIPEDAEAIAAIRELTIRAVVAPLKLYTNDEIDAWTAGYTADRIRDAIERGNFVVAYENGRVVASGRLQLDTPNRVYIRGVFVHPSCVGRGIGGAIVDELLSRAKKLGAREVELAATLNARSFYERHGFRCLAKIRHASSNGAVIPAYHMRHDLTEARGGTS